LVYIKEVDTTSEERRIAEILKQEERTRDPRNHCVPVINLFDDPQDPELSYLVMPFLRPMCDPPFQTVQEIVEFTDQILEGLVFLHEKGIAHRDCVRANIMMDADAMYPEGFHPVNIRRAPDRLGIAEYISRTLAGVKYYYVDFGISSHLPDTSSPRLVTGTYGRDQDPPELSDTEPYDPFKLDIFIIGNMLKREFCKPFCNLEFFQPLIEEMTRLDPATRPTAAEAFALWTEICDTIWTINREWRPRPRRENPIQTVILDSISLRQFFMFVVKSLVERLPL
jgi:serine/threonine protein kinase